MAVVKSNAYGHGMAQYAKALNLQGADWFGVDDINEALELRKSDIKKPILVLGFTPIDAFPIAAKHNISITISNHSAFNSLEKYKGAGQIRFHIKVDTGLHRQGFLEFVIYYIYDKKRNRHSYSLV